MKLILFILGMNVLYSTSSAEPVVVGETFSIKSEVLGHERRVHVYLPDDYNTATARRYPVIYSVGETRGFKAHAGLLDSLTHYRPIMPPVIYIALASVPEGGAQIPVFEMTPKTQADKVLAFLDKELIPYVDENYRTHPYRILEGGHLSAVFTLYTLMKRQDLFQAYIATTPYLFRDESILIDMASDFFAKDQKLSAYLFLSINDERLRAYYDRFTNILKQQAPITLDWHSVEYPDESRVPPVVAWIEAMTRLFADQRLDEDAVPFKGGVDSISGYFEQLSKEKYGYEVSAEDALNNLGHVHLQRKDIKQAIDVFTFATHKYPNSANLYDSLALAYDQAGELTEAISAQEKAVANARRGLNYGDIQSISLYESRLAALKARID